MSKEDHQTTKATRLETFAQNAPDVAMGALLLLILAWANAVVLINQAELFANDRDLGWSIALCGVPLTIIDALTVLHLSKKGLALIKNVSLQTQNEIQIHQEVRSAWGHFILHHEGETHPLAPGQNLELAFTLDPETQDTLTLSITIHRRDSDRMNIVAIRRMSVLNFNWGYLDSSTNVNSKTDAVRFGVDLLKKRWLDNRLGLVFSHRALKLFIKQAGQHVLLAEFVPATSLTVTLPPPDHGTS